MSPRFFVQRQGIMHGPLTAAELKGSAARGDLDSCDLIQREGESAWNPAARFKGLFEQDPGSAAAPPVATAVAATESQSIPTSDPKPSIADRLAEWRPLADRYSREFDLGMNQFLAAVAGSACLLLLGLSTLLRWEIWTSMAGEQLRGVGNSRVYSGLEVLEGKLVCLLAACGVAAFVATFFAKRLLPASLLVGAGVGTCSALLAFSYFHQINAYQAESQRLENTMAKNLGVTFGEAGGQEVSRKLVGSETDTAGFGLYLTLLSSLVVASGFVFASLSKPIPISALQKESVHPIARTHGALLITQAAALLIGMIDYVLKF